MLRTVLSRELAERRQITFARYLELVLHHPLYGYYASIPPRIGPDGDFYTSPDVSPLFGAALGRQVVEIWSLLARPAPFTVVEYGAGKGLLASDLMGWLRVAHPDLFSVLDYRIIEISPALRAFQRKQLGALPVKWMDEADLHAGSVVGCFLSNEVADALPWHRVVAGTSGLDELWVIAGADGLSEQLGPPSTPELERQLRLEGVRLAAGRRAEVNLQAPKWVARQVAALRRGAVLVIDYGSHAARLYGPEFPDGTLACYYRHTLNRDPFARPGEQDITAHVDFTALAAAAQSAGGEVLGYATQAYVLASLGLGDALPAAGASASAGEYVRDRQAVARLIDPSGLGAFRVLAVGMDMPDHSLRGFALQDDRHLLSLPVDRGGAVGLESLGGPR